MSRGTTTRTSPEVDEVVLDDYKTTIRAFNQGKLKNRLGTNVEEAMKLFMAVTYLRSPMRLKHLDEHVELDDAEIDNEDGYRKRVAGYVEQHGEGIEEAARMLQSGISPTAGTTELARATRNDDEEVTNPVEQAALAEDNGDEFVTKSDLKDILNEL